MTNPAKPDASDRFLSWWLETEPLLQRVARSYGLSAGDAHDVVADVALLALSKRPSIPTAEEFRKWALARLRWRILDQMRIARRMITLPTELLPERAATRDEVEVDDARRYASARLRSAIARLPPQQRAVMTAIADGKESDEIAKAIGVTQATVRSLFRFARHRVALMLGSLEVHRD